MTKNPLRKLRSVLKQKYPFLKSFADISCSKFIETKEYVNLRIDYRYTITKEMRDMVCNIMDYTDQDTVKYCIDSENAQLILSFKPSYVETFTSLIQLI